MLSKSKIIPLEPGNYYHIYNHAVGKDNLFLLDDNCRYFLSKFKEFISPVADTYSYCLMRNHFHFLIKIKDEETLFSWLKINEKIPDDTLTLTAFKTLTGLKLKLNPFAVHVSKQFSHFFNGYTQAINKQEKRMGGLFNTPFKRVLVTSDEQLLNTVLYIHRNPVHHGYVDSIDDWPSSSYHSLISDKPTSLMRYEVMTWFGDKENFIRCHKEYVNELVEELE